MVCDGRSKANGKQSKWQLILQKLLQLRSISNLPGWPSANKLRLQSIKYVIVSSRHSGSAAVRQMVKIKHYHEYTPVGVKQPAKSVYTL